MDKDEMWMLVELCLTRWKETTNVIDKLHDILEGVRCSNNNKETITTSSTEHLQIWYVLVQLFI